MKKLKKALLGTAIAGTLVVGAGFGTYSWFTAESKATGTIENGTFSLADMGTLFTQKKFAPSQVIFSEMQTIDNTGNMPQFLKATYTQTIDSDAANIKKYQIGYYAIKIKEKKDGSIDTLAIKDRIEKLLNGTANITELNGPVAAANNSPAAAPKAAAPNLATQNAAASSTIEFAQGVLSTDSVNALQSRVQGAVQSKVQTSADNKSQSFVLGDGTKFWHLNSNEQILIYFGVKLNENVGNQFQGVHYNADFHVEAKQTDDGAKYKSELNAQNQ